MANQTSESNRPVHVVRYGLIKAAVWRNMVDMGNASRPMYNVTLNRSYRDGEDNWKDTSSLGYDDLLVAAKALDEAHSFIVQQMARDTEEAKREERRPEQQNGEQRRDRKPVRA